MVEEVKVGIWMLLISSVIVFEVKEVLFFWMWFLWVLVVGGGIGGFVFVFVVKNKGLDVVVFEWDMSVIWGEG